MICMLLPDGNGYIIFACRPRSVDYVPWRDPRERVSKTDVKPPRVDERKITRAEGREAKL